MRARVMLQPTYTVAANTVQESRFAKPVGHGKTGVVIINVYRNGTGATVTFDIETASQTGLNATANTFWKSCQASGSTTTIATATAGAIRFEIDKLAEVIRWTVSCATWSAGIDFDITVFFADT